MNRLTKYTSFAVLMTAAATTATALNVTVYEFENNQPIPPGYVEVVPEVPEDGALLVSEAPFVDYLIPANSGSASVIAQKEEGQYLSSLADPGIFTNEGNMSGANSGTEPDRWHVVFEWTDGDPVPFGTDFYGVSWANWGAETYAEMTIRVDLPDANPVKVWHWFNDGWNYADGGHNSLAGHILRVTHYNAANQVVSQEERTLTGGKAADFFSDHRAFFAVTVEVQRQAEGDYVLITNLGGNIGYKGTVVELLEATGDPEWAGFPLIDGWADTGDFMGLVYPVGDFVYVADLAGWVYLPEAHVSAEGAWAYVISQ